MTRLIIQILLKSLHFGAAEKDHPHLLGITGLDTTTFCKALKKKKVGKGSCDVGTVGDSHV